MGGEIYFSSKNQWVSVPVCTVLRQKQHDTLMWWKKVVHCMVVKKQEKRRAGKENVQFQVIPPVSHPSNWTPKQDFWGNLDLNHNKGYSMRDLVKIPHYLYQDNEDKT